MHYSISSQPGGMSDMSASLPSALRDGDGVVRHQHAHVRRIGLESLGPSLLFSMNFGSVTLTVFSAAWAPTNQAKSLAYRSNLTWLPSALG
jgi:hypothetical protein